MVTLKILLLCFFTITPVNQINPMTSWLEKDAASKIEATYSPASKTFNESVLSGECPIKKGLAVYYLNRCPFAEFHAKNSLVEAAEKLNLPLTLIKLETMEQGRKGASYNPNKNAKVSTPSA